MTLRMAKVREKVPDERAYSRRRKRFTEQLASMNRGMARAGTIDRVMERVKRFSERRDAESLRELAALKDAAVPTMFRMAEPCRDMRLTLDIFRALKGMGSPLADEAAEMLKQPEWGYTIYEVLSDRVCEARTLPPVESP